MDYIQVVFAKAGIAYQEVAGGENKEKYGQVLRYLDANGNLLFDINHVPMGDNCQVLSTCKERLPWMQPAHPEDLYFELNKVEDYGAVKRVEAQARKADRLAVEAAQQAEAEAAAAAQAIEDAARADREEQARLEGIRDAARQIALMAAAAQAEVPDGP